MTYPNGTMLGRYPVDGVLGQGQTGIVYRGFDTAIERTVAIKCLRPWESDIAPEEVNRRMNALFHEAKVIGQLNHAHITAVHDMGTYAAAPYFVMERVEGETLRTAFSRKPGFPLEQILRFIVMVSRALHYVHQRGILHGDVKPTNILVTWEGTPKITDFGVARRSLPGGRARWSLEDTQTVWGTPGYLAPEQLTADALDARADVFSLGVIAYEWLAGRKPFTGASVDETLKAVLAGSPTPLSELGPCHPDLSGIIQRAIARRPDQRFASADALADALEVFLEGRQRLDHDLPASASPGIDPNDLGTCLALRSMYFADFSEQELACLLRWSRRESYRPDEVIVREGVGGSTMFMVIQGRVSVRKSTEDEDIEIRQCTAGDCFGEIAVISQVPRSATVVAVEPTEVMTLSGAVLRQASDAVCQKLYRNIAALLSERLRDSDGQVASAVRADRNRGRAETSAKP